MNFIRDHKNKIILITITIAMIISMLLAGAGKPNAGIVSNTVGIVLKPFQSVGTYILNSFKYGKDASKFKNENTFLKQQLITMTKKANDYDKLVAENEKLRSMLELRKRSEDYSLVAASVIGADVDNWSSVLKINKGLSDGINKNDAVITELGLVGYVSEVGRNWANITTIIDSSASVSAKVDRIDEYCMIQGDISLFDKGFCSMKYMTTESAISEGDILTTSGEGGIYPPGIAIGKINEIKSNSNGLSWDAVIEPVVDFSSIDEIFVIID